MKIINNNFAVIEFCCPLLPFSGLVNIFMGRVPRDMKYYFEDFSTEKKKVL